MKQRTADRMEGIEEYFLAKTIRRMEGKSAGDEIINLAVGNPDLTPPKEVIKELTMSVKGKNSHGYQPSAGNEKFRKAAAAWYKKSFGVSLDCEKEVISLIGSKEGIFHLSLAFLNKGDKVIAPDPGYPIYSYCASLIQAETVHYNLTSKNKWQIDMDELKEKCSGRVKIIWLNSPHMPTGSILKKKTFESVVQFARRRNILVVHDNPYSFILNENKPLSILSVKNGKETAVELCSLSKTYNMPGFRVAIAAGNREALDAIIRTKSIVDSGSYMPIQMGAVKALSLNAGWHKKLNGVYSARKKEVLKLAGLLNCSVEGSESGMFVWAKLPGNTDDKEFFEKLLNETNVLVTPGSIYGKNGKGYIRISLCQPVEKIKCVQERIKNIKGRIQC